MTTNYNSKRTWMQNGAGLTSSSQEVDHPGEDVAFTMMMIIIIAVIIIITITIIINNSR